MGASDLRGAVQERRQLGHHLGRGQQLPPTAHSHHMPRRVQVVDQAMLVHQATKSSLVQEHLDALGHRGRGNPQLPARRLLPDTGTDLKAWLILILVIKFR